MKALSLHPTNAAAVAWGDKLVEYRTWQTNYRGHCSSVLVRNANRVFSRVCPLRDEPGGDLSLSGW
jgi:hypothetical protein